MRRRSVLSGLVFLPGQALRSVQLIGAKELRPTESVRSSADGQIMENLDITSSNGPALTLLHRDVTVRNCRIRHAGGHGIHANGAAGLRLENVEVVRTDTSAPGEAPSRYNNIDLRCCPGAVLYRIRAIRGSSNIYIEDSSECRSSVLELHDARGPFPRGQNVQFNHCPRSVLEEFSAENGPSSWTEDNVSVFHSDGCTVQRGLVAYNNSPTGDGVMLEGSSDCLVQDVDVVQQGNGAFAAVPEGDSVSGGCVFLRCRTRASYNAERDGRAPPSSNGLSIYVQISKGAPKHRVADCHYEALANPHNLVWDARALYRGWSFTHLRFTPRNPVRLEFGW